MASLDARPVTPDSNGLSEFEEFFGSVERAIAVSLCNRFGTEIGVDAVADAWVWAWMNWATLAAKDNPAGYLHRVAERNALATVRATGTWNRIRRRVTPQLDSGSDEVTFEPRLGAALRSLSSRQRTVVLLTQGYGYTHQEVADTLGLSRSTIQNHADRGLRKLRRAIGKAL